MLVDSHCHLDFPEFAEDFALVMQRADEAGVKLMQTISTKVTDWHKVIALAEQYQQIYASIGIHPSEVTTQPHLTAEEIITYTNHPKVIGIGETGLDYYYEKDSKDLQITSFREHIKASRITGLPIIIHTRSAEDDTINILRQEMDIGKFPGLIHCFTSTYDFAQQVLELGLSISISGIVTFKSAGDLQNIVRQLPLTSLLIETDAPYLTPLPHRGKRNEPAYVQHTADFIASLRGISSQEVATQTTANFLQLFNKISYQG
jgi:TatD DNase family protein